MAKLVNVMIKFFIQLGSVFESGWAFLCFVALNLIIFFSPAQSNIYFIGALIVADVITALIAIFMQCKRDSQNIRETFLCFYELWTSKRAFDSIPKFIWYAMLVLLSFMMGLIFGEPIKMANLATGIIAYVEFRSIIENGDKAFGTNIWELVVDGAKKFFKLK